MLIEGAPGGDETTKKILACTAGGYLQVSGSLGGGAAHDAVASGNPVVIGGVAYAAAPTSVSADGDAVNAWFLRNGAQAVVLTAGGALIGGDATNGLTVDLGSNNDIQGSVAHDAVVAGNPVVTGGVASAAAPTSVSADGDAVRAWFLRNGAQATVLTAAGALVGGDAANGLDVDVTRVGGTVATRETAQAAGTGNIHAPASNTAAVITYAADASYKHTIGGVAWSYDAAPTGGSLTITSNGSTIFKVNITAAGPGFIPFNPPLQNAAVNQALVITLAAGGSGITGIVNALGYHLE